MYSFAEELRSIAKEIEEPEEGEVKTSFVPESVTVYFSAPDRTTTEEISEGGNFQWTRYELLFKREKHDATGKLLDAHHFVYKTPLYPWGTEAPGGQEVVDANPDVTEIDLTPMEAARYLARYKGNPLLEGPNLYPLGLKGFYVNIHRSVGKKKYPYDVFNRKFRNSGFYKVVTKGHELENP